MTSDKDEQQLMNDIFNGIILHVILGLLTALSFVAAGVATGFVLFDGATGAWLWLWALFALLLTATLVNFAVTGRRMMRETGVEFKELQRPRRRLS